MAQSTGRQAEEFHTRDLLASSGSWSIQEAPHYCEAAPKGVSLMVLSCANASATEEPDAGKPHVRDCAGLRLAKRIVNSDL